MNEIEYILRIVLKARDELARALARARGELRSFSTQANNSSGGIDRINTRIASLNRHLDGLIGRLDSAGLAFQRFASRKRGADDLIDKNARTFREMGDAVGHLDDALNKNSSAVNKNAGDQQRLNRTVKRNNDDVSRSSSLWSRFGAELRQTGDNVATLDNRLRGIGLLVVVGFAQQLITAAIGLGGELVALAGSAVMAGGALGGIFVAGIGQALPAVGLFAAALIQLKGVIDAVRQSIAAQQQDFIQAHRNNTALANSADQIANAEDSIVSAHRRVADAQDQVVLAQRKLILSQEALTLARRQARRDLEDLVLAEKAAELAARGAAISQAEAQDQLRLAVQQGDVTGLASSELGVDQSAFDAQESNLRLRRQRTDEVRASRGDSEAARNIRQAKFDVIDSQKALERARIDVSDAERGVQRAQRGLDSARRSANQAVAGTQSATATLDFLLSRLSPAERRLYEALLRIRRTYQTFFTPITDIIISSFTRTVNRVNELMRMPGLIGTATSLARSISTQLNKVFDALTTPRQLAQFQRIIAQTTKNLGPVTDIVITLGHAIINVVEHAGPALSRFIRFIGRLADQILALTEDRRGMEDFFLTGERHLESWITLAISVIRLFAALTGASAPTGLRTVNDATRAVDGLTARVKNNSERVARFFEDARKVTYQIIRVVVAIGRELLKSFDPQHFKNFADFLIDVLVPAFGGAIRVVGRITDIISALLAIPFVSTLAKWGVEFLIFGQLFASTVGSVVYFKRIVKETMDVVKLFGSAIPMLGARMTEVGGAVSTFDKVSVGGFAVSGTRLGGIITRLGGIITRFSMIARVAAAAAFGPWGLAVAAVIAAIVLLDKKFHFLRPTFEWLKNAFGDVIDWLKTHWPLVLTILTGPFGLAVTLIVKNWDKISGAISGALGFIRRIISHGVDWIIDRVRDLGRKILRILPNPFKRAGTEAANGLIDGIKSVGRFFSRIGSWLFDHVIKPIYDFFEIKSPSGLFRRIGRNLADGLIEGLKALPSLIINAFKGAAGLGKKIVNSLIDMLNKAMPDKIPVPGAPDIPLPDNPIPRLRRGGPIGSGFGGGDRISILAEAGEHMLTKDEVRNAGGHGAIFALRAMLGGGKQGGPLGFADGGAIARSASANLVISFASSGMDEFSVTWARFFADIVGVSNDGSGRIERRFSRLRTNIIDDVDKLFVSIRRRLIDIENIFDNRGKNVVSGWQRKWNQLSRAAFEGLSYIGSETNQALRALGEPRINFGLSRPQGDHTERRAVGGVIGEWGQRGRDQILTWLGNGEAVLNHWQQSAINSMLPGSVTVRDVVEKYGRGFHAGGSGEAAGFAQGRAPIGASTNMFDGHPSNVIPAIRSLITLMKRRFPALIVTSTTDHSKFTASGGISDHWSGHAVDLSSTQDVMNSAARFVLSSGLGRRLKQGIYAGSPQLTINNGQDVGAGFFGSEIMSMHGNHLHLALAALGSIANLITRIRRPRVTGEGRLARLLQTGLDRVRRAANRRISSTSMPDVEGYPDVEGTESVGRTLIRVWRALRLPFKGLLSAFETGIVESGMRNLPGGDADSQGWRQERASLYPDPRNIVHSATRFFREWTQFNQPDLSAGEVAARVQRPASQYRGRYDAARNSAVALLRAMGVQIPDNLSFARGGVVPGALGSPISVIAHAGEWILNQFQQSRLASMLGMDREGLRSLLGFHGEGGAKGFAGGGEVSGADALVTSQHERERLRRLRRGFYELPFLPIASWENMLLEVRRVFLAIHRLGRGYQIALARVRSELDRTNDQIRSLQDKDNLSSGQQARLDGLKERARRLATAERRLSRRQEGFLNNLAALTREGGILDQMNNARQRFTDRLSAALVNYTFRFNKKTGEVSRRHGDVAIAERAVDNARVSLEQITGEQGVIARTLRAVNNRLRALRRGGISASEAREFRALRTEQANLQQRQGELVTAYGEGISAIYQAQQDLIQAQIDAQQRTVDDINKKFEKQTGANEIFRRMATALGNEDWLTRINAAQRDILSNQADELQGRIAAARAAGADELADQLEAQVADLRTQIFESIQQELKDSADRINNRASRRLGRLDLFGRMADAMGTVGLGGGVTVGGETFSRAQIFQQRQQALEEQRSGLQGVLVQAQQEGNVQLIQDLTDQLAELDVAIRENTKAAFQARVDALNSSTDFSLNINDLNKQILELTGEITGNTDQTALLAIAQERGNILQNQRAALEALLLEAQQNGDQQAINDLTTQLLQNEIALLQNTQAVNTLNGSVTQPQTFTSSAWNWFREAIFNGMGQVLPQFDPSAIQASGMATSAIGAAGATGPGTTTPGIIAGGEMPEKSSVGAGSDLATVDNSISITVNEAGQPVDPVAIGAVVGFARKTEQ